MSKGTAASTTARANNPMDGWLNHVWYFTIQILHRWRNEWNNRRFMPRHRSSMTRSRMTQAIQRDGGWEARLWRYDHLRLSKYLLRGRGDHRLKGRFRRHFSRRGDYHVGTRGLSWWVRGVLNRPRRVPRCCWWHLPRWW